MNTLESSRKTDLRRKRLAGTAAALAGAVVLAVGWSYWRSGVKARRAAPAHLPAKNLPANAEQQLSGYSFTRSIGGRRVFTVHAAKTISFEPAAAGGATVLQDIWVEFFGTEGNRHDVLRTAECKYNPKTGALAADGKVELVLNADAVSSGAASGGGGTRKTAVFVETSDVSFEQEGSLLVSEEPVEFRVGPAKGSARGLQYDIKEGWLELGSNVAADFLLSSGRRPGLSKIRQPAEEEPVHLTASRLRYDKTKGEIALGGPVAITQGKRRVVAAHGEIRLNAANRVIGATLSGGVEGRGDLKDGAIRISAPSIEAEFGPDHRIRLLRGDGGVQSEMESQGRTTKLVSQTLEVELSGNPPRPMEGNASGSVDLTTTTPVTVTIYEAFFPADANSPARPGRVSENAWKEELTADRLNFYFQPGGRLLKEARTTGPGKLVFQPTSPQLGVRNVTSTPLVMTFDSRGKLTRLAGLSESQIVFFPPATASKGTPADVTTSDRFEALFNSATEALESLDEFGNVQFNEGDRWARADRAHFDPSTHTVELRGKPVVWDPETRVVADQIDMNSEEGTFEGRGHVQATHIDPGRKGSNSGADPTHVVADHVTAKRSSETMRYEGHVRAWNGTNVFESAELDISKSERRISSPQRVVTSHLAEAQPEARNEVKAGGPASLGLSRGARPVVISADLLDYFDRGRTGRYRGNVTLESQGTTVTADTLDVYFTEVETGEKSEIERAVATGHVVVVHDTRRATSDRAEYWAKEGKIELTGGPPALSQAGDDYVTGRRLTFFLADDTVLVDGDARSPTYSKHRIPK